MNGVHNYIKDGFMNVSKNGGTGVNYEPNSHGGPVENAAFKESETPVQGTVARRGFPTDNTDIDFEQPRALWTKVMTQWHRDHLVANMVGSMITCKKDIKERMIALCTRVHPDFGGAIAKGVGLPDAPAKL